ncbi:MAG TPA: redoxin family protein [Sphingobacterium sp.]|nr:redoxin family protein [Sphingobacterium sp.]
MKNTILNFLILGISLAFPALTFSQNTGDHHTAVLQKLDYPSSLAELLKQFEGKVVYIDVMASWCKPCIAELKETKKLQPYFEENHIVKLFLTIDNKDDIHKAFSIIQKDSLHGYFIASQPQQDMGASSFRQDIETLFLMDEEGNLDISIPRYAIVNKKGEIVKKRAARPSNPVSLKKQLESYL